MKTPTMQPATRVDAACGLRIINTLNEAFPKFALVCAEPGARDALFRKIFHPHDWKHLCGKFGAGTDRNDFGHFFLNLGTDAQKRLLRYLFNYEVDLETPPFTGWKELRLQYFGKAGDDIEAFTEDDVRNVCVAFGDKTKWDIYPHALVWCSKFLLFANNMSVDGKKPLFWPEEEWESYSKVALQFFEGYQGDKYGNAANWNLFWNEAPAWMKSEIVERLIHYN